MQLMYSVFLVIRNASSKLGFSLAHLQLKISCLTIKMKVLNISLKESLYQNNSIS